MAVSPIRYVITNFRLTHYIKIKQLSHVHDVEPNLGIKQNNGGYGVNPPWE